jgi:FKBP-type peptidyl-prolyl cis-trans isomerase FkpA
MKNLVFPLFVVVLVTLMSSCIKKPEAYDAIAQYEIEKPIIEEYVKTNYPTATFHLESGIWYVLEEVGQDDSYTYKFINAAGAIEAPIINVNYKGKLLNGTVFDEHSSISGLEFRLDRMIEAWQRAFIPSVIADTKTIGLTAKGLKKNSKMTIITPSIWGYRNIKVGEIPANSPLVFEIDVVNIKPTLQ